VEDGTYSDPFTVAVLELEEPQALAASASATAVTASAAGLVKAGTARRARPRARGPINPGMRP